MKSSDKIFLIMLIICAIVSLIVGIFFLIEGTITLEDNIYDKVGDCTISDIEFKNLCAVELSKIACIDYMYKHHIICDNSKK